MRNNVPRVVGTAGGLMVPYLYTSTQATHVINQTCITKTWGAGKNKLNVTGRFLCAGSCEHKHGKLNQKRLALNKVVTAVGDVSPQVPLHSKETSTLQWVFTLALADTPNAVPADGPARARSARCDYRGAPGVGGKGCVIDLPATYEMQRYGAFALVGKHVEAALASGLPGSRESGLPLQRVTSRILIDANRRLACPRSIARPEGMTCDEYPFASTLQGAAAASGSVRVFKGCSMPEVDGFGPNGFSRCMVLKSHNSAHGTDLLAFYRTHRILELDEFYITLLYPA